MDVNFVRNVDYYVGIPLCFLLSLVLKVLRFFRILTSATATPKNVLLIELSEMGSAILVDPAMREAQKHGAKLYFTIFKRNVPSLKLLNTVEAQNIFLIRDTDLISLAIDSVRLIFWIRKNKIDTVIDLELFSRFTALLTGLSLCPNRVGYFSFTHEGLYRGDFLTHKVTYNPHLHISRNFMALVKALYSKNIEVPFTKLNLESFDYKLTQVKPSDEKKSQMMDQIKLEFKSLSPNAKIILINPNASELLPQRRWMPEYYVELIKKILNASTDFYCLITGAPSESEGALWIENQVGQPSRCKSFAGKTTMDSLVTLYSVSHLLITNDSGPAHFAAVTDIYTFVFFGPETPKLYGSLGRFEPIYSGLGCSPCVAATNHRKTPCTDNVCLKVITPEIAFKQIESKLSKLPQDCGFAGRGVTSVED